MRIEEKENGACALKFDLLTMAAAGTACASALRFARFVTPDILETAVTRAIEPKLLFAFATAADAPLAAGLRLALAAAAEDVRADVLTAPLRFALPVETEANAAFTKLLPTPTLAELAAARGDASALIFPPGDATACAEAVITRAPTLVRADRASAAGVTRANEPRLPLAATTAGA